MRVVHRDSSVVAGVPCPNCGAHPQLSCGRDTCCPGCRVSTDTRLADGSQEYSCRACGTYYAAHPDGTMTVWDPVQPYAC